MTASDLFPMLGDCCTEVLEGMFFATVLKVVPVPANAAREPGFACNLIVDGLASSLDFSGDVSGQFGVALTGRNASCLAANFLGEEDTLTSNDISSVVGELANMLCGSVVSRIKAQSTFTLSHPEPLQTRDLLISADALTTEVHTDDGAMMVWIVVR
jgi:CheY-specific phosphatase CheX